MSQWPQGSYEKTFKKNDKKILARSKIITKFVTKFFIV